MASARAQKAANVLRRAWGSLRLTVQPDPAATLARSVRSKRLTYLDAPALVDLWRAAKDADLSGRPGSIVEAGTALGGSAIMLAVARESPRRLYLHDTFGMIPPPTEHDPPEVHERYREIAAGRSKGIGDDTYYGYQGDLRERVRSSLSEFGADLTSIELVQGLYEESLHPADEIAVAHIDCDWYGSVRVCLERVWPQVVPGGVVIIDDYFHWDGCRQAVDEFLAARDDVTLRRRARLQLVKAS